MPADVNELRKNFDGPHHLLVASDGLTLFLWKWEPRIEHTRKAALLLLHGLTAYCGPYSMMTEPLAERGFTIYGLDLRGHGLSDGNRGDYPSKDRLVRDICEAIDFVKGRHESVVVIGHSLGVLSSIHAMNHCLQKLSGAILLSGGRFIRPGTVAKRSTTQKLKILLSSIVRPGKPVIEYRREGMVGLDDPLFTFMYTLRFMRLVNFEDASLPERLEMPVFVGVGDSDELFSIESARALFESIPAESKEFFVAKGAKHAEFPDGSWDPLFNWVESNFD